MKRAKQQQPVYATCPECGFRVEVPAPDAVSAQLDPAARARIALGVATELGTHRCAEEKAKRTAERLEWLKETLARKVARAQDALARFHEKATKSVAEIRYQLAWSGELFELAGAAFVAEYALVALSGQHQDGTTFEPLTPARLHEEAMSRLMQFSATVSRSTSPSQNLMDDCERKAWAELVRDLAAFVRE